MILSSFFRQPSLIAVSALGLASSLAVAVAADPDPTASVKDYATLQSLVAKLAHEPTVALKETAGTPRGERLLEAVSLLFDL